MNRSTISRGPVRTGGRLASFAAMALGLGLGAGESRAQGPRGGEERTVQGRVESLTTAPMGEVDGARLDDGTTIHWPPHLADRFGRVVGRGDRVRVTGRTETGPEGDSHFEVASATNLDNNRSVENDETPPPPPPGGPRRRPAPPRPPVGRRGPRPAEASPTRSIEGRVESLTTAPMGEVDGARLDDGTTIHWPPHLADRFGRVISRGDRVRVSGRNETGPEGDTHFEVSSATNLQTRATVAGDQPDAPAEARPDGADDFGSMTGRIESLQRRIKALEEELARRPRRD